MKGKRLLRTLRLTNLLSYGPEGTEIELQPLNVLIGPNGSGKSNLIEAISLLKAAPSDVSHPIRAGGGMREWLWKGGGGGADADLKIESVVSYRKEHLRYRLQLTSVGQRLEVADEAIEKESPRPSNPEDFIYYGHHGRPSQGPVWPTAAARHVDQGDLDPSQSILSQRKDPNQYPELTYLGEVLSEIRFFRAISLGYASPARGPQRADKPASFLEEDGTNFGMVLNDLLNRPPTKKTLLRQLKRFYEPVEDITSKVWAGTVETSFHERGFSESVPSVRLSDGTLRYLCLLTILCHPEPPPLVCIEDPEIGLHPDALCFVAELLKEASQRMQLIVTTHSDILVSALSNVPEAVVVCERDDAGSHLRRLEPEGLKEWLEKYSLGELWRMGETGGNP